MSAKITTMKLSYLPTLLFSAAMALFCSSCRNDAKLHQLIESNTKECPIEVTRGFILERVTDDGSWVTYSYLYADSLYNPAAIQKQYGIEAMKQTTLRSLKESPESQEFVQEVANCGRGLKYVYIGNPSGDSCAIVIDAAEVGRAAQSSE